MRYKIKRLFRKIEQKVRNWILREPKTAFTSAGWKRWERRVCKLHPIRYWFTHDFYFWWYGWFIRRPGNVFYWIRTHTYNRYHLIDCRNYEYKWGWCDRDHLLLYAMMKILCDYIEKEKPFDVVNWDSDEGHNHAAKTMKDIYDWWLIRRPAKQKQIDELSDKWATNIRDGVLMERINTLEAELLQEEQTMMERLISIRSYMWT